MDSNNDKEELYKLIKNFSSFDCQWESTSKDPVIQGIHLTSTISKPKLSK